MRIEGAILRRVPCLRTARYPPRLPIIDLFYRTILVSSRTAFFPKLVKGPLSIPPRPVQAGLMKVALWSKCNRRDGQDISKNILMIQSSDGFVCSRKPNFAARVCPSRRERVRPRMVEPPSDRDACFGLLDPAYHI